MARWRPLGIVLSVVGLVDAVYLLSESLFASIPLYCPSTGTFSCALVTSSSYSKFAGVPVALLGVLFFAGVMVVMLLNNPTLNYLLMPAWVIGVIFVGYLVSAEVFALHAICLYCTLDHVLALALGLPAVKMALGEEG